MGSFISVEPSARLALSLRERTRNRLSIPEDDYQQCHVGLPHILVWLNRCFIADVMAWTTVAVSSLVLRPLSDNRRLFSIVSLVLLTVDMFFLNLKRKSAIEGIDAIDHINTTRLQE